MSGKGGIGLALLGLLVACASDEGKRSTFRNEGVVCIERLADGRLRADVRFPTCLSSSCDRELYARCSVTADGDTLRVQSEGASESTGASECTDDCGNLTAQCETEAETSSGRYTIEHGAQSDTLELGAERVCAFGP